MENKFTICTAIAYANAIPHIGHALEFIQADVLARYNRMKGKKVYFQTGTDEYGQKIFEKAEESGMTPQQLVDDNSAMFADLNQLLGISHDYFIRTTSEKHKKFVQEQMWKKLEQAGDIYKANYKGLYCVGCEKYIPEKELVDGKCAIHLKEPRLLEEENYFFKLSKYSEQILKLIESDQVKVVPTSRKNEILSVLREGLEDVSFSRPKSVLNWGIEVPSDPDHVMYVWCDALTNYLSGMEDKSFWPANVQLIGKDILRFHAAIWIGMLLSAGYELPERIYVHGFLTSEGMKMSKSLGNVVNPFAAAKLFGDEIGPDVLRYYLLKEIPTTDDGDFSMDRFKMIYSEELGNKLGNLVSRVASMNEKYFEGIVPSEEIMEHCRKQTDHIWAEIDKNFEAFDLKKGVEAILSYVDFLNKLVDDEKPWALAKTDQERLKVVIYNLLEGIRQVGVMIKPIMPVIAGKIEAMFEVNVSGDLILEELMRFGELKAGKLISKPAILFPKLEVTE